MPATLNSRAQRRAQAVSAARGGADVVFGLSLALPGADGSLHVAAHIGSMGFTRLLLSMGVDVDAADAQGATALHYAAACGHAGVLGELLSAAADVGAQDHQQQTPLHYAASGSSAEAVCLLLRARGDPRAMDLRSDTPLSIALQARSRKLALAMVPYGSVEHGAPA